MAEPSGLSLDEETVRAATLRARERLRSIEQQRAELDRAARKLEAELQLLEQLLELGRGQLTDTPHEPVVRPTSAKSAARRGTATHPAVETIVSELAVVGRPMHVSDMMRVLRERHVQLPGAATQANLIALLRRDARVMRPSRGMYALVAWGLTDMEAVPRVKRRKIRRRVRVQTEDES